MPDFIRDAIIAQGKIDPDAVEAQAETLDLDALDEPEKPVERRLPYKDADDIPIPEPEPEQTTIDGSGDRVDPF